MTSTKDDGSTFGAAIVAVGLAGAGLSIGAFSLYGGKAAGSTAFGTLLAVANLWVLGRVIRAMLPEREPAEAGGKTGSAAAWGVFALLKVFGLFGLVLVFVNAGWVTPLGFLAGYGALPIGIVMAQLARGMSSR